MRCPWLTRTAGRPVYRPEAWDIIRARLGAAIGSFGAVLGQALTPAMQKAAAAFQQFGVVMTQALAVPAKQEGESTPGSGA